MSKHSQISALFCGSRNLFWAREPRGSCIRPSQKAVVECHGSTWNSQSVAVAQQQATSPSREGTDSGQPRQFKERVPHGKRTLDFDSHGHLALSGTTAQKGKYSRRNLSLGPPRWPRHV